MRFGLCSYPHGGLTTFGFLVLCMGAIATTAYAVASCHFVIVEFTSTEGGFDEFFEGVRTAGNLEQYKVGAGLFTWLKPIDNQGDWSDGECIGYSERQRDELSDGIFEASRLLGVFVVLFGFVILVWAFLLACLAMRKWQLYLLRGMLMILTIMTCLEFLIKKSALCQDVQMDTTCKLDAGGLVNIAGALMWFAAFLLATFCMRVSEQSLSLSREEYDEKRRSRRERREREKEDRAAADAIDVAIISKSPSTPDTKGSPDVSVNFGDEEDMVAEDQPIEVSVGSFLDRVEFIVDEE